MGTIEKTHLILKGWKNKSTFKYKGTDIYYTEEIMRYRRNEWIYRILISCTWLPGMLIFGVSYRLPTVWYLLLLILPYLLIYPFTWIALYLHKIELEIN
ncbi:hypothetical protein [Amedibacillus sp. YH-ame10]